MVITTRDKPSKTQKQKFTPPSKPTIIAFLSQKGGVGKTTTATHARDWFEQFGTVGFVDADAQRSSSKWLSAISQDIEYTVMGEARTLLKELPNVKEKFDYVIVDAPGSMEDVSRAILSRCDIVIIPCQTSQLDLDSNDETIEMVEVAQDIRGGLPKAALFFNRAEEGTILLREALEAASRDNIRGSVFPLDTVIHQRQCIMDVPGQQTTAIREARRLGEIRRQKNSNKKRQTYTPIEIARNEYCELFEEITRIIND
ncbi:MAG: ParA family protein [Acaryochloris sp. RU_4_1]|nr:ParA family protein [Acaryochloris sp. RU_4_1]NJR57136.1 ParA family protein [Acaryochloris sp. CRU_2_0]